MPSSQKVVFPAILHWPCSSGLLIAQLCMLYFGIATEDDFPISPQPEVLYLRSKLVVHITEATARLSRAYFIDALVFSSFEALERKETSIARAVGTAGHLASSASAC